MAHAATGFARRALRRQIIACTSSIGPGAANMITAAGTASANRIPLLLLPGDVFATRQPDPVLQQIEQSYDLSISTNDAFRAVSKYWDRITRPEQLMSACINAMRVLTDPAETGAVTLCLPQDAGRSPITRNPSLRAACTVSTAARPAPRSWRTPWWPSKAAVNR